jgi:hypothetical protein
MLWVFGVIFALLALGCIWLAILAARGVIPPNPNIGNSQHMVQWLFRGIMENGGIATLCIFGWYLMRKQTKKILLAGALAVMIALFISMQHWLYWKIRGGDLDYGSWFEPIFVWPFFAYVFIYAYRKAKMPSAS